MRSLLAALLLLLAPALARADLGSLRGGGLLGDAGTFASARLDLPALDLGPLATPASFALERGAGPHGRARAEPVLCLVLGIIPGFGIGHYLAGSDRWVLWLVADIAIAVVFWGPFWYWPGHPGYFPALSILVLVERIFEGILAHEAAGGGRLFRSQAGPTPTPPALAAIPVGRTPGVSW